MRINNNLMAMNTHRQLGSASASGAKSMEKLSSGLRINRAGDDAAGLSISEKMRAQIRGLNQASRNSQDAISMIQTAEGALGETQSILQRMRELATQASSDTNVEVDREAMQNELNQLTSEINRIGNTTEFNTQKLLNGGMDSSSGDKVINATAASKTLSGSLGSTNAVFSLGTLTDGTTTAATAAKTADITYAAGDINIGTWIEVDGKLFTNKDQITLTAGAGAANAALIGNGFTDADGNKLSEFAKVEQGSAATAITIESNTNGALSSVKVQTEAKLTGGTAVVTDHGSGVAIVVDGKGFDLSGFITETTTTKKLNETIAKLGAITATDGTKLSDMVNITSNEKTGGTTTSLTFTAKASSGTDSTIRFESYSAASAQQADAALGLVVANLGVANQQEGTVAEGATKSLSAAATQGTVTTSTAATMAFTTTAGATTAADSRMIINGKTFDIGNIVMAAMTASSIAANSATNWDKLKDLTSIEDPSVKLSDLVEKTVVGTTMVLTTIDKGGANKVELSSANISGFNAASTSNQGAGTAVVIGDQAFELGGLDINVATMQDRAETVATLGEVVVSGGGTTKLSDVANISFDEDGKLTFEAKIVGPDATIEFKSSAANAVLGTVLATDIGTANIVAGTGAVGEISDGTKITVNNTTFDLGGISINNPADTDSVIESLGNATSGGVKLSELVDIAVTDGKVSFTTKGTGETATISFEGSDGILGVVQADTGAANAVTGNSTTVERTGVEGSEAIDTTADVTIAANSSFRVKLGDEGDVTVNLTAKTYNTNDEDPAVVESALADMVKDVNAALQEAGLSGKVSASLSQDNKLQFISEENQDIVLSEGVNSPLSGNLGYAAADLANVKNVQQVVGAGTEGSGFTAVVQVGANEGQSMSVSVADMRSSALGVVGNAGEKGFTTTNTVTNDSTVASQAALDLSTNESAGEALTKINAAIEAVSAQRSQLGAFQNRLEHTIKNLETSSENLQSSESRIRDVDMAKEMMDFTKNNILTQAAQAMLAQANQAPQGVLQLLR